jgi:hypothetical protein
VGDVFQEKKALRRSSDQKKFVGMQAAGSLQGAMRCPIAG